MGERLWKFKFRLTEVQSVGLHCMIISHWTAQITKNDSSFCIGSKLQRVWPRNRGSIRYSTKSVSLPQVSPHRPTSPHSLLLKGYRDPLSRKKVESVWSWLYTAPSTLKFMYVSKEQYSIYCLNYSSKLCRHRKWIERDFHTKWRRLQFKFSKKIKNIKNHN